MDRHRRPTVHEGALARLRGPHLRTRVRLAVAGSAAAHARREHERTSRRGRRTPTTTRSAHRHVAAATTPRSDRCERDPRRAATGAPRSGASAARPRAVPADPPSAVARARERRRAQTVTPSSARRVKTSAATIDPSPTAAATRFVEPWRTSPAAKSPTRLVSSGADRDRAPSTRAGCRVRGDPGRSGCSRRNP